VSKKIGLRIKALREKRGISQSALGEAIGVSYQQIQKYENGITPITVERLQQIGTALGIFSSDFLSDIPVDKVREETKDFRAMSKGFYGNLDSDEVLLLKKFRTITNKRLRQSILFQVKTLSSVERGLKRRGGSR
jgi:transcriptional regulator with XRE-family HTH domain